MTRKRKWQNKKQYKFQQWLINTPEGQFYASIMALLNEEYINELTRAVLYGEKGSDVIRGIL